MESPTEKSTGGLRILYWVLPIVFCVIASFVLCAIVFGTARPLADAANTVGFVMPESVPYTPPAGEPETQPEPTEEPADTYTPGVNITPSPRPQYGAAYGQLTIDGTSVDCAILLGDSETQFSRGGGTYAKVPGENSTVLIGGHTGTYFRDFESAQLGAQIKIATTYGTFYYEIEDMKVVQETDIAACRLDAGVENVVLYTCYPFGQLQPTDKRYFIYGRFLGTSPVSDTEEDAG